MKNKIFLALKHSDVVFIQLIVGEPEIQKLEKSGRKVAEF